MKFYIVKISRRRIAYLSKQSLDHFSLPQEMSNPVEFLNQMGLAEKIAGCSRKETFFLFLFSSPLQHTP